MPVLLLNQCRSSPLYINFNDEYVGSHDIVHEGVHGVYLRRESHWNLTRQDDFDYMLSSGDIHDYVRYLLTLYPSGQHIPDLGLRVDQWLQLYDLRDHELFLEEIAFNGGEKGSEAITARTSSRANWNTSTTLDRNLSKPASVADPHSANQVPAIAREEIKVFALTRRSEFVASSINRDDGKTAECFVF